jgi:site-specific DNA-methyltransferase (adenine-specific)
MPSDFVNQLHYGENLVRLRGEGVGKAIPDEVADPIYLDPPFNSARNYNLLFKQHKGQDSPAQIMTFEDTWTYSPFLMTQFKDDPRNSELFELIDSLHRILGPSEMMAHLLMMAPRLLELHGKLKKTGSLYLHCYPVASHYLNIIPVSPIERMCTPKKDV